LGKDIKFCKNMRKANIAEESRNTNRHIYGVDFSGASDAGRKIWIAGGIIKEGFLQIQVCNQASDFLGANIKLNACLETLRDFIAGEKDNVFGFDFPFGLPRELIDEISWEDFVLHFPENYKDPGEFRSICRKSAKRRELKRITDVESKAPFSPYNLRVYRQTYYGIHYLLQPLVKEHLACILPMQDALPDKPWLLEICPASTLKKLLQVKKLPSYKGTSDYHYKARGLILDELTKTNLLLIPRLVRSTAKYDSGGDALDSIVAAYSTFHAYLNDFKVETNKNYNLEGYVFI
jgi:hypothetical protein